MVHSHFEQEPTNRPSSLWLDQALDAPSTACPRLTQNINADVAIIGGGYVGLWTAIELKSRRPDFSIAILESDICGSGASGRNGGYVLSWWTKAPSLLAMWGADTARDLILKSEAAITLLDDFCKQEDIDAEFSRSGWVWGAASQSHIGAWESSMNACASLGVADLALLDEAGAQRKSGGAAFRAAIHDRTAALIHPGKLVRGLREAALRRGIQIFEHSPVEHLGRGRPAALKTRQGSVTAKQVVIATNAWAASVRELSRSIAVVSSDIIASPPVPNLLAELGWQDGAGVNDSQQMVHYVRPTRDGRILAGKGGLASGFGGNITNSMFSSERRARIVESKFRQLYPGLDGLQMDCHWSGPVDRSADGLPIIGTLPRHDHIAYAIGWSGNGVGPSQIGAKAGRKR
ncbi:MAG: FAD-binding oxidoreductase [Sphingomonadales bacterium]|nr:FAD-binding oxidoreductase [Sphingomonadales bacterium]